MFEKRKAAREEAVIKAQFPLFPFDRLESAEARIQARAYLRMRLGQVAHLHAVPGESEYVIRSATMPDRRLDLSDQRLTRRLDRYDALTHPDTSPAQLAINQFLSSDNTEPPLPEPTAE